MTAIAVSAPGSTRWRPEIGRWTVAGTAVVAAHALLVFAATMDRPAPKSPGEPPAAILIELEAVAPSEPALNAAPVEPPPEYVPDETPPEPPPPEPAEEAEEVEPEPPEPEESPEPDVAEPEPPEPEEPVAPIDELEGPVVTPEPEAPVIIARLPRARPDIVPQIMEPKEPPKRPKEPAAKKAAKKARAAPASAAAAAPRKPSKQAAAPRNAVAALPSLSPDTWRSAVHRHLQRHKRYPREAEMRRVGGTVRVYFQIDASGNIVRHRITASSGHAELDQAVSQMIARASPVPAPPAGLYRPGFSLEVPIKFSPK